MADLTSELVKEYGYSAGARVVGIASAADFGLAPEGFRPADQLEGCRSVIVLGDPSPKEVLSSISEYTANRNALLTKMTAVAKDVAKRIKTHGYATKAISGSGVKTIEGKQYGHISLKHAAELAGLGQITRNYLLTSPQYGNLLWFSAVLTDADLSTDPKVQLSVCDHCDQCVQVCPLGALKDPASFGIKECSRFFTLKDRKFQIECYACRTVCPACFGIGDTP